LEDRLLLSTVASHIYELNGSLADQSGGPALVADGGVLGATRYTFGANQGLRLTGALADTTNYSVAIRMEYDSLSPQWKKVLDFSQRASDSGLYIQNAQLNLIQGFTVGMAGASTVSANTDFYVVLTRNSATGEAKTYLNGVLQHTHTGAQSNDAIASANVLTFFEDDVQSGTNEAQAGSTDCIAIYNGVLTPADVSALYQANECAPSNQPPTVAANTAAVSANEAGTVSNSGTFSDAQGNSTVTISASVGTVTQNDAAGTWSWSLNAADGPAGPISVTITASDGVAAPVTTSFDYSVNNLNPDAVDDVLGATEGGSAQTLALLGNDTEPAGANDPLSIASVNTTGTVGQVTLASGVVSYSPNGQFESLGAGETTDDTFSYSISDGDGGTDTATVTVTITGQNDAPTATGTLSDVSVNQNAANSVISLAGRFADVDANDTLTITAVSSSSGLVTAGVSGGLLTLDYQANQNGTATITVTATDGSGASVDLTFNVAVLSPAHLANGIIQLINQWKSDGKINAGVANSMIVKVVNSLKSYDNGNITAAGNQLNALKNEISAKVKPGSLTDADATLANSLIDALFDSMTP
jgi:VCBS repeat-containing protein